MSSGTSRRCASAMASGPHGHQSTGLSACWSRYGEVALPSRFTPTLSHTDLLLHATGALDLRAMLILILGYAINENNRRCGQLRWPVVADPHGRRRRPARPAPRWTAMPCSAFDP